MAAAQRSRALPWRPHLKQWKAFLSVLAEKERLVPEVEPWSGQSPAPAKKPTGKKPGAQPRYPPLMKALLPPERVQKFVRYIPKECRQCAAALPAQAGANDPEPTRHQVAELPKVAAEITEYQGHPRTCSCCGAVTRASIPGSIRAHSLGARLTAALLYFVGVHGVSKRGVEEIAEHLFEVPIALGTVANREQELSVALVPAHEEARAAIASAAVKHADETGWKEAGKKRWLCVLRPSDWAQKVAWRVGLH